MRAPHLPSVLSVLVLVAGATLFVIPATATAEQCVREALRIRDRCADVRRSCLCDVCPEIEACGGEKAASSCGERAYEQCAMEYEVCDMEAKQALRSLCNGRTG